MVREKTKPREEPGLHRPINEVALVPLVSVFTTGFTREVDP
jgi:hypothetical protein